MKIVAGLLVIVSLLTGSAAPPQPKVCTPDSPNEETHCYCLTYHPEKEFCKDETLPYPSCCKAAEKDSGITYCGCCRADEGDKKVNVQKRGTYKHEPPIVEYSLN